MKYILEFRRSELVKALAAQIRRKSKTPARIMEFCGGHTVAILRFGIRRLLPPHIQMLSGPGCPVCVTDNADLDKAIALSKLPGVILTTFGDMLKVPGSRSSLQKARAEGADVRIVYSVLDALRIARENPSKSVIFLGIGFETTAPTVAAAVLQAAEEGIRNFFVFSLHKLTPPVVRALLESGEANLTGIICPGHVSTVIGSKPWEFAAEEFGISCAVAGFEPVDILLAVEKIVEQIEEGKPRVEIAYTRSVRSEGNKEAQRIMYKVFEPCTARWRGIGEIPSSGLKLREEFSDFDAALHFDVDPGEPVVPKGCICGEILRGVKTPLDCKLFRRICNPDNPVGPCMVSSEGACAAYYHYGGEVADEGG